MSEKAFAPPLILLSDILEHTSGVRAQAGNVCVASFDWSYSSICKSTERVKEIHQRNVEKVRSLSGVSYPDKKVQGGSTYIYGETEGERALGGEGKVVQICWFFRTWG